MTVSTVPTYDPDDGNWMLLHNSQDVSREAVISATGVSGVSTIGMDRPSMNANMRDHYEV